MKKFLLSAVALFAGFVAKGDDVPYIAVGAEGQIVKIPLTEISEVLFGDTEMKIVKTDETTAMFANADGWILSFCYDESGVLTEVADHAAHVVKVYDINGVLVSQVKALEELDLGRLPKGVYIISTGNRQFKVCR